MVRKTNIVCVIAFFIFTLQAHAAYGDNLLTKLSRGLCNIVTCPMEIIEQSKKVKDASGSLAGMTYGLGKGVVMTCVRGVIGAYEVVTFPIPYPNSYGPILTDPVSYFPEPRKE